MSRRGLGIATSLALILTSCPAPAAPWLVFSEVNYHSRLERKADDPLEFVELHNLEAPGVNLEGWKLEGEVDFVFPPGTRLEVGECLVVAKDPRLLAQEHPAARRILGPFAGRLDDSGGRLVLRNPAGAILAQMRYGRDRGFSAVPDGTGHTLVLRDPYLDPTDPRNWAPSAGFGGSPGKVEFSRQETRGDPIIRRGETWRFFRGSTAPPADWTELDADDSLWEAGPSGFGYSDGDDATVIDDMRGSYLTIYTRKVFTVEDTGKLSSLLLRADFDDGLRAVLNGKEIARANLPRGTELSQDTPAMTAREAGSPAVYSLGPASGLLRNGKNILAVEAHNNSLESSDLSLIVELEHRVFEDAKQTFEPAINEVVDPTSCPASEVWVEIHNPSERSMDVGGYFLSDDPRHPAKFKTPAKCLIAPHGVILLSRKQLGPEFSLSGDIVCWTRPGAERVVDALRWNGGKLPGSKAISYGRYPDGSAEILLFTAPTPGRRNVPNPAAPLVINEIMYHPIGGESSEEFIEIFHRGAEDADLSGFRLRGGARYDFPEGLRIAAGGYLVLAREPEKLAARHGLPAEQLFGPFEGRLSDRSEGLSLLDPMGILVDRVAYSDGDPWPEEADGRGPSLELISPSADNSLAQAWAASDEASRSRWTTYRYTKAMGVPQNGAPNFLQLMLLDDGECIVDDILLEDGSGRAIVKESFDGGRGTSGAWIGLGTHQGSGPCRDDGGSYRVVARGGGNPRFNYACLPLPEEPLPGSNYTLSFKARWLRGTRLLLTRLSGQLLAKTHSLSVPSPCGSPGRRNTRESPDWGPVVGTPEQRPVAPRPGEPVQMSVPISAGDSIARASIFYRAQGGSTWLQAPLCDDGSVPGDLQGDGIYLGKVPPTAPGVVEFYISARDARGRSGTFPRAAPDQTTLYAVHSLPAERFPAYTILISDREWEAFRSRDKMSNLAMDATLVYEATRIFHGVKLRLRGSPFTRSGHNWRLTFGSDTLDGRRSLTLDAQGGSASNIKERLTYWLLDELKVPTPRQRYVTVHFPGHEEESGLYEDVERPDSDFLARWFEGQPSAKAVKADREEARPRSLLHKVDDHWELTPSVSVARSLQDLSPLNRRPVRVAGSRTYQEAFLDYKSEDPEDYRWNFPPRADGGVEDFGPLIRLARTMDPAVTSDRQFCDEVESIADIDEWLRVLAARTMANDWDSIGRQRGKNSYLYLSAADGMWRLIPWDADLSWSNSRYTLDTIFPQKFPEFVRLLSQPKYRRRFLGYIAYLAERKMEPACLKSILDQFNKHVGASDDRYSEFAEWARQVARRDLPRASFRLRRAERQSRENEPDVLRASGTAPVLVYSLTLSDRSGECSFLDDSAWVADFPVGPEGGEMVLKALDFGGGEVARAAIQVAPREGAGALPDSR